MPFFLALATSLCVGLSAQTSQHAGTKTSCPMVRIETERLPDLDIARSAHATVFAGGELTVVGGHTAGFMPTPTIEYFSNGRWRQVPMVYTHDHATTLTLNTGKVLIMGGCSEPLGIGQTFTAEMYDPATHSTEGFGCLDTRRTLASAVELDSGRVLISGNWYHDDAIELFDGKDFSHVKEVTQDRVNPYILPISGSDALIFGSWNNKGELIDTLVVDRLKGAPFHVALTDKWLFCNHVSPFNPTAGFIGDERRGDYRYLIGVVNKVGEYALVEVHDTVFSLLPTTYHIPTTSPWDEIAYGDVMADRTARRAYMLGVSKKYLETFGGSYRLYVLGIDYGERQGGKIPITLYYTDPLTDPSHWSSVMADNGDIIISGSLQNNNYKPSRAVYRLLTGRREEGVTASSRWMRTLSWLCLAAMMLTALVLALRRKERTATPTDEDVDGIPMQDGDVEKDMAGVQTDDGLMQRICQLMEENRLFLDSDLKLSDVASALGTNRNVVSNSINQQRHCSFSQFVGEYRVRYAQQLMLDHPEMKMTEVWIKSGFATESSFFRMFRSVTGMTPTEWKTMQSARK